MAIYYDLIEIFYLVSILLAIISTITEPNTQRELHSILTK